MILGVILSPLPSTPHFVIRLWIWRISMFWILFYRVPGIFKNFIIYLVSIWMVLMIDLVILMLMLLVIGVGPPKSTITKLSSRIYHFFNHTYHDFNSWNGWKKIWNLKVAPHVQHFIWICLNGKLATYDFLHSINAGPL